MPNSTAKTMATLQNAPLCLIIMDGWGIGDRREYDAVAQAKTPNLDRLAAACAATTIAASGEAVGLPEGQMGNSEVGHTNIGAGRIIYQELTRITLAIKDGSFCQNPALNDVIDKAAAQGGALHLFGLLSPGGVHSHTGHLYALLKLAAAKGLPPERVLIHCFLDGRDVPPKSAGEYLTDLEEKCTEIGGKIATVSGRYYAMDRDKRWDRVAKAYDAIARAKGEKAATAAQCLSQSYEKDVTDEFVLPTVIGGYGGMAPQDSVIFYNFRPDRARELTHAFTDESFAGFPREEHLRPAFATMTRYEEGLNVQVAYPPQSIANNLGEYIMKQGLTQLRIAETEKYAHVTFFFNGGVEEPYSGEDRILIPSPAVPTYDQQPEMSAIEVTDKVIEAIRSKKYDFIILNYANGDMVGHTGIMAAAVKACETVDTCVGRIVEALKEAGGAALITADHGNAEKMRDEATGEPHTAHTTNLVPLICTDDRVKELKPGRLCDLAPTLLKLAGLPQPEEMTGTPLF